MFKRTRQIFFLLLPAIFLFSSMTQAFHDHKHFLAPFAPKGTKPRYARDLPYQIQHLHLELTIEPQKKHIKGQVTLTMRPNARPLREFTLDAAELQIQGVFLNGKKTTWQGEGHKLHIQTGAPIAPTQTFQVRIAYQATPRVGLHFILPDKDYPNKPVTVFSQGESENNRFWYPSFDTTNMRFTSETHFTVPSGFQVVTNGRLISKTPNKTWVTYHHKMEQTHVNYLLSVVVGKFATYTQTWDGITIRSLVPPADIEKAKRSFQYTPDMMKFFSEKIGFRYPYAKYDQVTVHDFIAGGMENISATTLAHRTLHDARAHLDRRSDDLVAHELAHQWFGDLLTCKDWSHIWLNESFASYFNQLFTEHKFGQDDFDSQRYRSRDYYMHHSTYKRAIVTKRYFHPGDVFDSHSYPKGAAVLHMIRRRLGDELWWKAINHYVKTHAFGLVETVDLRRSLEAVSGLNWEPFFDQWIYRAGHPSLDVSWKYDAKNKLVTATIQQKTKQPYHLETTLTISEDAKVRRTIAISIHKKREVFSFPATKRPKMLEFDAAYDLLAEIRPKKSWQEWLFQLQHGSSFSSRLRAAKALRKFPNQPSIPKALLNVLRDETLHWYLRETAVGSLAHLRKDENCRALRDALTVKEARIRAAIARSLGQCGSIHPLPQLTQLLRKDISYAVRIAATSAIAKLRFKASFPLLEEAYKQKLDNGSIRTAALQGMISLEDPGAITYLRKAIKRGQPRFVRLNAISGFARIAKLLRQSPQIGDLNALLPHLQDPDSFVRNTTVYSLGILGDTRAIPHLRRYAEQAPTPNRTRDAQRAIETITKQDALKRRLQSLGTSLESIRKEQRKLLQRLEKMERIRRHK
ncbi:MAG: HEAT repeat domain-containing protein [Myxococcales bacterium]|nr:HEAT repeat domain-containing protein [Myxococcales bacterium]